jgi:hypothetical protein
VGNSVFSYNVIAVDLSNDDEILFFG